MKNFKNITILLFLFLFTNTAFASTWTETSFDDFADGKYSDGGANIYTSIDGTIRLIGQEWDVNGDGWMDIVFSNCYDDTTPNIDSYIYFGSETGFSEANRAELETHYASGNSIADLNNDGYADIVFSNHLNGTTRNINSFIYWGSETGFSNGNKTELQTVCATGNSISDLNRDGYMDIVLSNTCDDTTQNIDSFIYWGSDTGFSNGNRTELQTHGTYINSVADLNGDGYLDIVFANGSDDTTCNINSFIYWGSDTGFSNGNRTELQTHYAHGGSISDLNGDGYLDIVFANGYNDTTWNINSFIYWGSETGFSNGNRTELQTHSAHGNSISDLNCDGYLDIVFANHYNGTTRNINSFVYWGSGTGFSEANRTELATHGVQQSTTKDLGDVYNRGREIFYTSNAFPVGTNSKFLGISWLADTPLNTSVEFQIRSAQTEAGLQSAQWFGPTGTSDRYAAPGTPINPVHNGDSWIEYRAFFLMSQPIGLATPALHEVSINYSAENMALSLDGDGDNVEIPDSASLDFTNQFALEAWIKISSPLGPGDVGVIISKRCTDPQTGYELTVTWFPEGLKLGFWPFGSNAYLPVDR